MTPDIDERMALIIGVNGGFGRLFARELAASGMRVAGADLAANLQHDAPCAPYLSDDATAPSEALRILVGRAACVMLCVPEAAAFQAIDALLPQLQTGALFVDTLSVKTPVAARLAAARPDIEMLSLNPLFSPELGLRSHNVAAVGLRSGRRSAELLGLLEARGAAIRCLDAQAHDRAMAATQVATHAAILAFGLCLRRLDHVCDPLLVTPPHATLLALLGRISARDPEVYRHIQTDNPFAAEARRALAEAVDELIGLVERGESEAFARTLTAFQDMLAPVAAQISEQSRRLFS